MFCSNLEINLPADLPSTCKTVGDKAFYGCTKLTGNIKEIVESNVKFGKGVFMQCSGITGPIQ